MLAAFLAVGGLVVAVAVVVYVMSGKAGAGRRGVIERLGRYVPFQSVKIVIVAWQILTQVRVVRGMGSCHVQSKGFIGWFDGDKASTLLHISIQGLRYWPSRWQPSKRVRLVSQISSISELAPLSLQN